MESTLNSLTEFGPLVLVPVGIILYSFGVALTARLYFYLGGDWDCKEVGGGNPHCLHPSHCEACNNRSFYWGTASLFPFTLPITLGFQSARWIFKGLKSTVKYIGPSYMRRDLNGK